MTRVEVFIFWPGDERRIVIEGELTKKGTEYLMGQIKDDPELINVAGIRPKVVQVGSCEDDFQEQRAQARMTNDPAEIVEEVTEVVEELDDDEKPFDLEDELADIPDVSNDDEVLDYEMPFGKHKGKTLWQIACEAPKYLDWAAGEFDQGREVDQMIQRAVNLPAISKKIDAAVF